MILAIDGLLAGAAHVLTGPDHLVGVAPLAVEEAADGTRPGEVRRIRPWLVGASWGVGHGVGVAILGVLGQTLLSATQVDIASGWSERLVGVLLVGLGIHAVRRGRRLVIHEHRHVHDDSEHVHLHVHGHEHKGSKHDSGEQHRHAALGIGLVHGLAGAGHFWAVLPSLAMGRTEAATYIAAYIVASIALMTVFGALLGRITRSMGTTWMPRFFQSVGALTVAIGVWWIAVTFS